MKYMLYRLKWHLAKYISWRYPLHVDIELTSRCNLKCGFCPHSKPGFESSDMDMQTFTEIIYQIKDKVPSVKFNLRGESTMHPHFTDMIMYAWGMGSFVDRRINTNGQYKDTRINAAMVKYLTDISFSVDAWSNAVYKKVRKASILPVENNIKEVISLIKEKKGKKPILRLSFTITDTNKHEVEPFKEYWKSIYPKIKFTIRHAMDRVNGTHTLGEHTAIGRKNCLMPARRLAITSDGQVSFCCLLWHTPCFIGDFSIVENGKSVRNLIDIWRCFLLRNIRKHLKNKNFNKLPTMCKECDSSESYIWRKV
jgi:MoaA/NifB/PqqE/SkfB family radical SAM enzyme